MPELNALQLSGVKQRKAAGIRKHKRKILMAVDKLNTYPVFEAATRANPQAVYARMREHHPIHCEIGPVTGNTFWIFTRYEDVVGVLKDQRFGKDFKKGLPPEL